RRLADGRLRAAQSVAVLLRPRDERPLDRRRRPGSLGGDRLPERGSAREARKLRLESLRGQGHVRLAQAAAPRGRARLPGLGVLARSGLLRHGGLRLPRVGGAGRTRPLLLRRLLQRPRVELPRRRRPSVQSGAGVVQHPVALVVRRGRERRALRDLAQQRDALQARSVIAPPLAALVLAAAAPPNVAWTRFGYTASRTSSGPAATGITAAGVGKLRRQAVRLDGTVDASPIYLHAVQIGGAAHDAFFV